MKKIIPGIIICLLGIFLIFTGLSADKKISVIDQYSYKYQESDYYNTNIITTKYIDIFQDKLRNKYNQNWIEIQDFFVEYKKIRFAHVFYNKTFVCADGKLIIKYNGEEKEIFTLNNKGNFGPCTFNVTQTSDENIFLIDFCLSWLGSSGECFGHDMYYNVEKDTWKEGKMFLIGYENEKRIKMLISETNLDLENYQKEYDNFIENMKGNTYFNFQ